jgi:hypothetical protein
LRAQEIASTLVRAVGPVLVRRDRDVQRPEDCGGVLAAHWPGATQTWHPFGQQREAK